jgi:tetratricopeptide (TPR) repeat protein
MHYKEITVRRGEDITIRIPGSGWYLNRYGKDYLSFKSRFVEPLYTDFIILPLKNGNSYLFFTYMNNDIYILVRIVESGVSDPRDESMTEGEEIQLERKEARDEIINEQQRDASPHVRTPVESDEMKKSGTVRDEDMGGNSVTENYNPEGDDIFYLNEDNEIVAVPYKNEDDLFFKGTQFSKRGKLSEALQSYLEYISQCTRCIYIEDAHFETAKLYMREGEERRAGAHLDILIERDSKKYKKDAYIIKAQRDLNAGDLIGALELYKNVLGFEPKSIEIIHIIGDIYFQLEEFEEALNAYEKAVDEGLDIDEVYFRMAKIYDSPGQSRNLEKAYTYYKIIIDRFTDSEHYTYANKRVAFLEKNFYKFR